MYCEKCGKKTFVIFIDKEHKKLCAKCSGHKKCLNLYAITATRPLSRSECKMPVVYTG